MKLSPMKNDKVIRVVIVDDHKVVIEGFVVTLKYESGLECCGSAQSIQEGLEVISQTNPDVVVVDLSLQSEHGLDLVKDCKIRFPSISTLVVSMHDESVFAERAIRAGALGYIMKNESFEKIVDGIRAVDAGELYVSSNVKNQLVQQSIGIAQTESILPVSLLGDRELEVFTLIGHGLRPRHLSERLNISVKTVESHCRRIRQKLNINDMETLIDTASKWVRSNH